MKMSWYEKVFQEGSIEIGKLKFAAYLMENKSPNHWRYIVSDTYFDLGQNWRWTTILYLGKNSGQALTSAWQRKILSAEKFTEIEEIVEEYFADKYCGDKQTKAKADDPYDGSFNENALYYLGW